jgi:hypothetical protein
MGLKTKRTRSVVVIIVLIGLSIPGGCKKEQPSPVPTAVPLLEPTATLTIAPETAVVETPSPTVALETPSPEPTLPAPTDTPAPTGAPASPPEPLPTSTPRPETPPLAIQAFRVDIEELDTGKRLTFNWETTGATKVRLYIGTAQRFMPWWELPPNGTHTVELAGTLFRDPQASLSAFDADENEVTTAVTIAWPCTYTYFFTPEPQACPTQAPIAATATEQPFENGRMIWLEEVRAEEPLLERVIFVFYNDGRFDRFDDTWTEDQPESDPALVPPAGLIQPIRGFGKVWRENARVRERLGWGLAPERGFGTLWQGQTRESIPSVAYLRTVDNSVLMLMGWGMMSGSWETAAP